MSAILINDEGLLQQLRQQLGLEAGEVKEVLGYLDTFLDKDELSGHLQGMLGDDEFSNKIIQRAISVKFPPEPIKLGEIEKYTGSNDNSTLKDDSSSAEFTPKFLNKQMNSKNLRGSDPIKSQSQFYRKGYKEDLNEYRVTRKSKPVATPTKQTGNTINEHSPQQKTPVMPLNEAYKNIKVRSDRKECACYGLKHEVFLNCLRCGRIACKTEGPGPCFFCKFPLLSADQQRQDLQRGQDSNSGSKAQAHLERLLEFDRTSVARTKVIDQASDYAIPDLVEPTDQWLSPAERLKSLESKKEKLDTIEKQRRGPRVLSLDLENRKVSVAPLIVSKRSKDQTRDSVDSHAAKGGITFRKAELPRAKYIPPPGDEIAHNSGDEQPTAKPGTKKQGNKMSEIEKKRAELRVSCLDNDL